MNWVPFIFTAERNMPCKRMVGIRYEVSDLVVTGDTITYNWQYFKNDVLMGSGTGESMVITDGKIVQFNST